MLVNPDLIVKDVFAIDLATLQSKGISGLLIDIDNTIVPWEKSEIEEPYILWINSAIKQGFKICLVSNATEKRANYFGNYLQIPVIGRAFKPLKRAFQRGLRAIDLEASQVAIIGDQLFTDVLGGNRLGLFTILVNPLSSEELGGTKIMRKLERRVLNNLVARGKVSAQAVRIRQGGNINGV